MSSLRRAAGGLLRRLAPRSVNRWFWELRGRAYAEQAMSPAYRAMYEELARLCLEPKPRAVLEIGCGYGYLLKRVYETGGKILGARHFGVDLAEAQVRGARRHFPQGKFFAHDLNRPLAGFADAQFDVVAGVSVLMYLNEAGARGALRELRRVCGRRLVLAEQSVKHLDDAGRRDFDKVRGYDGRHPHDFEALLKDAGFSRVEVRRIEPFFDPALNAAGEMPQTLFLADV